MNWEEERGDTIIAASFWWLSTSRCCNPQSSHVFATIQRNAVAVRELQMAF